ncbi:purine-cytosine permease family protein [Paenarthrobacter sp. NPDC090520]|uniref:purine-cytosine permease family protein n=1 Tax=Paenarthrobacter sp. NPDC090520 TaxID=3364382 RepID=UPI0037F97580
MASGRPTVETRSIEMVPPHERHGSPKGQFTLWFGANAQITAIVDGALAVVFGADAFWAIVGLFVGNILGGIVMALHSAQGPRLGLPQMISSRAQFGVYGAIIPLVLVILMYIGFASTGTVLSGQAINLMLGTEVPAVGIIIFGATTALLAILGYKYIHALGRVATVLGLAGFLYLTVAVLARFDMAQIMFLKGFEWPTFLTAIALGAGWQMTFGPYVADYSRYLPQNTSERKTFWYTFAGSVGGAQWAMTLGAVAGGLSAAGLGGDFLKNQVGYMGDLAGGGLIAIFIYLVIVTGKLTVNCLNAYGSFMCAVTISTAINRRNTVSKTARITFILVIITISVLIALFASKDFLNLFKNFVLMLLMVFTPWSVINLIDYYKISRDRLDVPALYTPDGQYGRWNTAALLSYAIGILCQIPFLAQTLYTGPVTHWLGGADISWIVGIIVTAAVYYPWAKATNNAPKETIYPQTPEPVPAVSEP